ncbi:hypothetical protein MW887_002677 [Aspergillus wentii]|nr:hypothetical protein MW887_002677 [Aspergillus wentii]
MAKILDVEPLGQWRYMTEFWWQIVFMAIFFACVASGCLYLLYAGSKKALRYYKSRPRSQKVPEKVSQRLDALSNHNFTLSNTQTKQKPSSFGVYLGSFSEPVSQSQRKLLSQWDLLIVDPLQSGVINAISNLDRKQVLGRIDLSLIISQDSTLAAIENIENILTRKFNGTAFSGVLLANWEDKFTSTTQKKLVEAIHSLGLAVYLETSAPEFLTERNVLQTDAISGLVIRNVSILPNGEKRDYFQMEKLQPTIKAFVSESCVRDFVVMAWETVDDDVSVSNAVVRRSLQWCNFYSAIASIGSESALHDADLNARTVEPLPAFGWLKESEIMKAHDNWRFNMNVEQTAIDNEAWNTLLPLFPSLQDVLESAEFQPDVKAKLSTSIRDPPEWVAQIKSQGSPLSISMSGVEYKSFGCFPLGSEATAVAFAEILQSQQRLKSLGLLHPVPTD